ncbi:flagellar assembly peptidoglycan hydrolase FlgJ [Massilia sp. TS11]|uniref:flagellar assembly peptidoglycan hydrolase FlgJ n=1 Tax=Massilia sp. TS11 TaxID=2908003 RepID=UPI001EDA9DF8|nr:flagellar assembly peptidoglycan hydrolase FlgJ [Massilia sp. TS11]MCG2582863.1 flagellar assembly peptidoglycan hydrolase FlgJ [Massilia sp. TS11]
MVAPASTDLSSRFALDTQGLSDLKRGARTQSPEALKQAATQFEAMFLNMMMKSMRQASASQDGMFDSEQTKTYTQMLDQQLTQKLAKRGVGLADMLVRQMSKQQGPAAATAEPIPGAAAFEAARAQRSRSALQPALTATPPGSRAAGAAGVASGGGSGGGARSEHVQAFQDKLSAAAEQVARASGIPAKFMIGQAALETGWGRHEIKGADGSNSFNLFGIKAGPNWKGRTVTAVTTEYVNGVPQTRLEKFRAYDSYAASLQDYANLLQTNPRYEKVLASAGDASAFARGLQQAGYATDPLYAQKLERIIKRSLG